MPVLDTTWLVQFTQRHPKATSALRRVEGQPLIVPFQAAAEYLSGVKDPAHGLRRLRRAFHVEHTDDATLLAAVDIRRQAPARRLLLDAMVAAHARAHDTFVLSANARDFRRLGVPAWDYLTEPDPPSGTL